MSHKPLIYIIIYWPIHFCMVDFILCYCGLLVVILIFKLCYALDFFISHSTDGWLTKFQIDDLDFLNQIGVDPEKVDLSQLWWTHVNCVFMFFMVGLFLLIVMQHGNWLTIAIPNKLNINYKNIIHFSYLCSAKACLSDPF